MTQCCGPTPRCMSLRSAVQARGESLHMRAAMFLLVQPEAPPALGAAASGSLVAADFFGELSCVSRLFSVVSSTFFLLFHGSHTMIDVFWGLMHTPKATMTRLCPCFLSKKLEHTHKRLSVCAEPTHRQELEMRTSRREVLTKFSPLDRTNSKYLEFCGGARERRARQKVCRAV